MEIHDVLGVEPIGETAQQVTKTTIRWSIIILKGSI